MDTDSSMRIGALMRLVAAILDSVLLFVGYLALMFIFALGMMSGGNPILGLLILGGGMVVYASAEIWLAASPGKYVIGYQIADASGQPASTTQLILRFLLKNSPTLVQLVLSAAFITVTLMNGGHPTKKLPPPLSTIVTVIQLAWFIGVLFIFTSRKQTMYDRIAGTAVFHRSDIGMSPVEAAVLSEQSGGPAQALSNQVTSDQPAPRARSRAVDELIFK